MIERLGEASPAISSSAFVHHRATVIGDVVIEDGASIWPGAVLRGDFGPIRIGPRTSIQDNAVIHADERGTVIGADCIVAHLAFVEAARIEDACLVGVGAYVLHGACLRTGAVAAAGAVLVEGLEVPTGHRAQGVPATVVATSRPSREEIVRGAARYVEMARRHAADARRLDDG